MVAWKNSVEMLVETKREVRIPAKSRIFFLSEYRQINTIAYYNQTAFVCKNAVYIKYPKKVTIYKNIRQVLHFSLFFITSNCTRDASYQS